MSPAPGGRLLRFVGDRIALRLVRGDGKPFPDGWQVRLRTNIGRAQAAREEIIAHLGRRQPFAGRSWRDVPMQRHGNEWISDLALYEVGWFRAKAYAIDAQGHQHWPDGEDLGIAVHPCRYRTANTMYCAFARLFGPTTAPASADLPALDAAGWTVIPPSGTLRDLARQVPHIVNRLGCRILHLLPISPVPTVRARYGRFGSPYAVQDLTAVDPALTVFDRRTTGVDQFRELSNAVHGAGGRLFLDMVINHTGWGSTLFENHPDWFKRTPAGDFASPGAWGVVWEDLVELDHRRTDCWRELAEAFLTWCRRGVDGFRCDAGWQVPCAAWQYITARVRQEFPDTVFLLEGLGGSWEVTERLLGEGGLQWAYSELFQNYEPVQVAGYLDHAAEQSARVGVMVNYSETHDNDRLAKGGQAWATLRNRLCALTADHGAFGFTCGVEWLADQRIDVHQRTGMAWDAVPNLVDELGVLDRLIADHPCWFDGAQVRRLSADDAHVLLLRRDSANGRDRVLVAINLDLTATHRASLSSAEDRDLGRPRCDLVTGAAVAAASAGDAVILVLPPGAAWCLAATPRPLGLSGEDYRRAREQAAWAYRMLAEVVPGDAIGACPWPALAALVEKDPARFLAAASQVDAQLLRSDPLAALADVHGWQPVVRWTRADAARTLPLPAGHWLLVDDSAPFHASLDLGDGTSARNDHAIAVGDRHLIAFPPRQQATHATLTIDGFASEGRRITGAIRYLAAVPALDLWSTAAVPAQRVGDPPLALLTNGRGGMARLHGDLGAIASKYDCLLGANLHDQVPCDRHILAKRLRAWLVADGFITALDRDSLASFSAGPPAQWRFTGNAGDGRTVAVQLDCDLLAGRNTLVARFRRLPAATGRELPAGGEVRLVVRIEIEDRSFHSETVRTPDAARFFADACRENADGRGFAFTPAADRRLRVVTDRGRYHHEGEWATGIQHAVEAQRGMISSGDAYSPGWFDLPLGSNEAATLTVCAENEPPPPALIDDFASARQQRLDAAIARAGLDADDAFGRRLAAAAQAYVVRRGSGVTVIAGYPWFLDWGRDSLIAARGLLAAGLHDEVAHLITTFGRHEAHGTLPNLFHGEDASNRDTSDAPLWYGVLCEDAAALLGRELYRRRVAPGGHNVAEVLTAIAEGYRAGAPNGIRVDPDSGLVWSPSHFTWMDTNHPAGTPRQGYPVEIQCLWIRLLRHLARLDAPSTGEAWTALAGRASASLERLFWLEDEGWLADVLSAGPGVPAAQATVDHALRSNGLFAASLGLMAGVRAQRIVLAAVRHLIVPGGLRSLAPLPVTPPLPIRDRHGNLLNDPERPYWPRYEGDEDSRRKPAYHNGTAWTWTFPVFCEALAVAWEFSPAAVAAARSWLGSVADLLPTGCLDQIPEILDGDHPHQQRGCDAQAWGVSEALRVWKLLGGKTA